MWKSIAAIGLLALAATCTIASACSAPPFNEMWTNQGTATWIGTDSDCRLESTLAANSDGTAAAVAHYRRHYPSETFRASFRVGLPTGLSLSIIQNAQLFRGVAKTAPAAGPYNARMLGVTLGGNVQGTKFIAGFFAACGGASSGQCVMFGPQLDASAFPLRVTVDLTIGAGSAGTLKYWLGDDVSGPPTGTLTNLDNAAWGGVERVSLGLSDSSSNFRQVLAGRPIVLDQVIANDTGVFWSDFDSSDIPDLVPNAAAIPEPPRQMQGSTCGGTNLLPQVASGASALVGPVAIHAIPAGNTNLRQIQISTPNPAGSAAFLCGAGLGPASPCTAAIYSGTSWGPLFFMPSLFDRALIVGRIGGSDTSCYSYTLTISGTLGANEP